MSDSAKLQKGRGGEKAEDFSFILAPDPCNSCCWNENANDFPSSSSTSGDAANRSCPGHSGGKVMGPPSKKSQLFVPRESKMDMGKALQKMRKVTVAMNEACNTGNLAATGPSNPSVALEVGKQKSRVTSAQELSHALRQTTCDTPENNPSNYHIVRTDAFTPSVVEKLNRMYSTCAQFVQERPLETENIPIPPPFRLAKDLKEISAKTTPFRILTPREKAEKSMPKNQAENMNFPIPPYLLSGAFHMVNKLCEWSDADRNFFEHEMRKLDEEQVKIAMGNLEGWHAGLRVEFEEKRGEAWEKLGGTKEKVEDEVDLWEDSDDATSGLQDNEDVEDNFEEMDCDEESL
ncbi:hypothetical protein DM02DRAFT_630982 [Periconia macrospinosa]|uniref:Uncharacterized protein n=1 Tax=Periconia macrospinosa TaxID=97972 RepID=A0A2V1DHH6_9PLEO|nr:hypothetical protein DM02DRAFT_630982 [Periconia macrospinosa]